MNYNTETPVAMMQIFSNLRLPKKIHEPKNVREFTITRAGNANPSKDEQKALLLLATKFATQRYSRPVLLIAYSSSGDGKFHYTFKTQ